MASDNVLGRSLLELTIGLNIRLRKPFRVQSAPRTCIEETVQGSVELDTIYHSLGIADSISGATNEVFQTLLVFLVTCYLLRVHC